MKFLYMHYLNFCLKMYINLMVPCERDSKIVFDALNGCSKAPTTIANIIDGIQHKFKDFHLVLVTEIKRQGNRLTHLLVQHAKNISNYMHRQRKILHSLSTF